MIAKVLRYRDLICTRYKTLYVKLEIVMICSISYKYKLTIESNCRKKKKTWCMKRRKTTYLIYKVTFLKHALKKCSKLIIPFPNFQKRLPAILGLGKKF